MRHRIVLVHLRLELLELGLELHEQYDVCTALVVQVDVELGRQRAHLWHQRAEGG